MSKREEAAQQRRDDIIEAALDLFTRKGYHGGSIREIAKNAGITEGLIYHYFEGKEDIYRAIVDKMMGMRDEILEHIRLEKSLDENIRTLAGLFVNRIGKNPFWVRFVKLIVVVTPTQNKELRRVIAGRVEQGMLMLGNLFDLKKEAGEIRDIDGYLTARLFIGGMISFFILQYILGIDDVHKVSIDEFLENSLDVLMNGISKR